MTPPANAPKAAATAVQPDEDHRRSADTASSVAGFQRDGYATWPAFLTPGELHDLRRKLDQFLDERLGSLPREDVFFETLGERSSLKQIQRLQHHDSHFADWLDRSAVRTWATQLLGEEVHGQNLQYFDKPPEIGQPTPAHQDGYYFMIEPCHAITLWLALDPADTGNGCVRYITGSHQRGLRNHSRTSTLGFSQGIADFPSAQDEAHERALPAAPGDLLAHHALTIHRADGNPTIDRHRRALGFIYYAASAKPDEAAHAAYQRKLAEDLRRGGRI